VEVYVRVYLKFTYVIYSIVCGTNKVHMFTYAVMPVCIIIWKYLHRRLIFRHICRVYKKGSLWRQKLPCRGEKLLLGSHLKLSKVAGDFLAIPGYSIFPMAWEEKKTLPTLRYIYSSREVIRKFVRLGKVRAFCCFCNLLVT